MVWEKLRTLWGPTPHGQYRVVPHRPLWRALLTLLLMGLLIVGVVFGYWLGGRHRELDRTYLSAQETRAGALDARVLDLERALADARLAQSVDAQAARSLRETISELRHELGALDEEVTFYKSLMAPSSIERGLQIAEFDLAAGAADNEFVYRLLLTQAAERRSWIQGRVRLELRGVRGADDGATAEAVLPLTELTSIDDYPLKFRFRYFQDLSGTVTIPEGFLPQSVHVTATLKGKSAAAIERSFDWLVRSG
ncbi:MAG: hypothetical protein RIC56_23320 [Pseudomonadales bacterium]